MHKPSRTLFIMVVMSILTGIGGWTYTQGRPWGRLEQEQSIRSGEQMEKQVELEMTRRFLLNNDSGPIQDGPAQERVQPTFEINLSEQYDPAGVWKGSDPIFHRAPDDQLVLVAKGGPDGYAVASCDEGRTWQDWPAIHSWPDAVPRSVIRKDGELLLFGYQETFWNRFSVWRSADEGQTWSKPTEIITSPGKWAVMNDRVLLTNTGRLIVPIDLVFAAEGPGPDLIGTIVSEDGGRMWRFTELFGPPPGYPDRPEGFGEPACVELADGRIWMVYRTRLGHLWQAFSTDGAYTFRDRRSTGLVSPLSAVNAKRIPGTDSVVLVWNNANPGTSMNFGQCPSLWRPRAPLVFALSHDSSQTWSKPVVIYEGTGVYPSICFSDEEMFVIFMANPNPAVGSGAKYHLELAVYDLETVLAQQPGQSP